MLGAVQSALNGVFAVVNAAIDTVQFLVNLIPFIGPILGG